MTKLTLKRFREITAHIPEETPLYYHAYYKGLCLGSYTDEDIWLFPKGEENVRGIVINPGDDYDGRRGGTDS